MLPYLRTYYSKRMLSIHNNCRHNLSSHVLGFSRSFKIHIHVCVNEILFMCVILFPIKTEIKYFALARFIGFIVMIYDNCVPT